MSAETDLAEAKRQLSTAQITATNAKELWHQAANDYEAAIDRNLNKYGSVEKFPLIIQNSIAAAQTKVNVAGQTSKDADAAVEIAKDEVFLAEHNAAVEQKANKQENAIPGPGTDPAPAPVVNTTPAVPVNLDSPPATIPPVATDASYDRLENNRLGVTPPDTSYDVLENKRLVATPIDTSYDSLENKRLGVSNLDTSYDTLENKRLGINPSLDNSYNTLENKRLGILPPDDSYTKLENKKLGINPDDGSYDKNEAKRLSSATAVNKSNVPDQIPSTNPLRDYASYTYNISLHALTSDDYTALMENPQSYVPKNVLISSAGRRDPNNFTRNARFKDDFFFESLSMTTVIAMSAESRNSNAIELKFTIVEPYGMTLMNRIIETARDMNIENFRAMPYLMQIDFFGYKDDGIPIKIPDITKTIPISFISFVTKVTTSGATYDIEAVPYNHGGFLEGAAATPRIKLEVLAQTVGEFFMANEEVIPELAQAKKIKDSIETVSNTTAAGRSTEVGQSNNRSTRDATLEKARIEQGAVITALQAAYTKTVPASLKVKSYANAINAWNYNLLADSRVKVADKIRFEFMSDKMVNAKFPDPEKLSTAGTPMKEAKEGQNGLKTERHALGKTSSLMSINQGTLITDVIGLALRNSSYITDQLSDSDSGKVASKDDALEWFKIIPRIKLLGYDDFRNTYAKEYIYTVVPYKIYNTENSDAPMGRPKGWVKTYNYMFTGKNEDILNFDIQFDALYWTAQSAGSANKDALTGAADAARSEDPATNELNKQEGNAVKNKKDQYGVPPEFRSTQVHVANASQVASLAENSLGDKAALAEQMLSAAGDLLSVNLKIVGDPDFIKQDDLFYSSKHVKEQRTPNGSIATDEGEIFMYLNFNTPVDYNDKGLADPATGSYVTSSYSGLYKVITVRTTFSGGKFEQDLETVRYAIQPVLGIKNAQTVSTATENARPNAVLSDTNPSDLRLAAGTAASPLSALPSSVTSIVDKAKSAGGDLTSVMGKIKDAASTATSGLSAATAQLTQATTALGSGFSNLGAVNIDVVGKLLPTATNAIASGENIINKFKAAGPIKYGDATAINPTDARLAAGAVGQNSPTYTNPTDARLAKAVGTAPVDAVEPTYIDP